MTKITKKVVVTDAQKEFQDIKIKERIWAKENLSVTVFKNGDELLEAKTDKEWKEAHKKKKPAFCFFRNDNTKDVLYNWWAIEDERGLAPEGWIIPNENDFYELVKDLGGDEKAFHALKSKLGWEKGCEGNGKSIWCASATRYPCVHGARSGGSRAKVGRPCVGCESPNSRGWPRQRRRREGG